MSDPADTSKPRIKLGTLLPLLLFIALAGLFMVRLATGDPQKLPSALIGKPAPTTPLPPLDGLNRAGVQVPGLSTITQAGTVTVLNVFASWCVPCRDEHPSLLTLAQSASARNVRLVGLNYKDKPEAALAFLKELGNPYAAVGVDPSGRAGIDWGVYGVPETFIIRADGVIAYKHVGPISPAILNGTILPEIEKARR